MTLLNPKYDIEVEKLERDNHGRLIIVDTKMIDTILVDLSRQVQFFDRITDKLSKCADENNLIGGDFNCSLTHLHKVEGKPVENKKCVIDKISNLKNLYCIHDVWREKNPNEKQFTWRDKAFKVRRRLDYFLVSQNLVNLAKDCHIIHAQGSDHCAVKLFIQSDSPNKKARPRFWKFNSSLLEDESYITELKENIKIYRNKYQCVEDRGLSGTL